MMCEYIALRNEERNLPFESESVTFNPATATRRSPMLHSQSNENVLEY